MGRPYKNILLVSAAITALLFWLDRDDGGHMQWGQLLFEIVVFGGMYTLLFFLISSGIYYISDSASNKAK
jgi:hypothetical protein